MDGEIPKCDTSEKRVVFEGCEENDEYYGDEEHDDAQCDETRGAVVSSAKDSGEITRLDEDEEDGESGLPTTAVVGAVAAGGTVFLCCVCAVAQIRKKRRKERNAKYKSDRDSKPLDSTNMSNPIAAAVAASSAKAAKAERERRKSSIFSSSRKMSLFGERKKSVVFAGATERKKSIFAAVFGFAKDEDLSGLPVYQNSTFVNCEVSEGLFAQDKNAGVPVDRFRQYVYGKRRGASSLENEFKV
ncbi:hypothetical protein ACOMHN_057334 [Nucella lapillus]